MNEYSDRAKAMSENLKQITKQLGESRDPKSMYLETFKPIKYSLKDSIKFILWSTKIGYQPKW